MSKNGAVGYARVSTEEQARENNSLFVQKRKIAGFCEQNRLSLLNVFQDSESGRNLYRPEIHELITFCEENRKIVACVVVSDLSRLARNLFDQATIISTLTSMGIELRSVDEPNTDDSAMGKFLRNQLGSMNQLFSDSLSERTRDRMKAVIKATGRFLWGAPLGYLNINKKLQIDLDRGPLVSQAFELVASGRFATTDAVLRLVTAMGLRTKKGNVVTKQSFARMLSNPIYAGWIVSGELKVEGMHEPLVSRELFDFVQRRVSKKAGIPHKKLRNCVLYAKQP